MVSQSLRESQALGAGQGWALARQVDRQAPRRGKRARSKIKLLGIYMSFSRHHRCNRCYKYPNCAALLCRNDHSCNRGDTQRVRIIRGSTLKRGCHGQLQIERKLQTFIRTGAMIADSNEICNESEVCKACRIGVFAY